MMSEPRVLPLARNALDARVAHCCLVNIYVDIIAHYVNISVDVMSISVNVYVDIQEAGR